MPADEISIGAELAAHGFVTMMIGDTPWIFAHGYNYSRGFSGWQWIRGQESDRLCTYPFAPDFPCEPEKLRLAELSARQYLRNVARRYWEEDYFPARTMREAAQWLEENRTARKLLPLRRHLRPARAVGPARHYLELYEKDYQGERVIYPRYDFADYLTREEIKHMRAAYAGEVTLVDTLGRPPRAKARRAQPLGETAVIFTTDHGFCLGEHNLMGKSLITEEGMAQVPLWDVISHIPLFVRVPGVTPRRSNALVQTPDVTATIYDLAGVPAPKTVQGKSLLPIVRGKTDKHRDIAVSSSPIVHGKASRRFSTITDGGWQLIYGGERYEPGGAEAAAVDSIMRKQLAYRPDSPGIALYDLATDPDEVRNLAFERPDMVRRLHERYVEFLNEIDCPQSALENRLRLPRLKGRFEATPDANNRARLARNTVAAA